MTELTITPAEGLWVVRARGAVIAESRRALAAARTAEDPVIYFPVDDIAMAFLDRSAHRTETPHTGVMAWFAVAGPEATLPDAAWTLEDPPASAAALRDHIAFQDGDDITVERL